METLERDTITPLDWLTDEIDGQDDQIDSTKMTTLNSDTDGPLTTYTTGKPEDADD